MPQMSIFPSNGRHFFDDEGVRISGGAISRGTANHTSPRRADRSSPGTSIGPAGYSTTQYPGTSEYRYSSDGWHPEEGAAG